MWNRRVDPERIHQRLAAEMNGSAEGTARNDEKSDQYCGSVHTRHRSLPTFEFTVKPYILKLPTLNLPAHSHGKMYRV